MLVPMLGGVSITLAAILLLVVTFIYRRLRQWQRLRHIPGPPLAGFSRFFWLVGLGLSGEIPVWMRDIEKKYGRLARVGPNTLVTSDWKLWRRIMSVRSPYTKSDRYTGFRLDPQRDHIVSTLDEHEHSRLRSIMIHGYSGKEVEGVEEKMDADILTFVHLLESRYMAHNKAFDFGRKAQYLTIDVVAHLAYGKPFGFLATDSDVYNYIDIIEKQFPLMSVMTNFPEFVRVTHWPVLNRLMPSAEDKVGLGKLMGIAREAAATRFGPEKKVQKDMLGSFVARGLTQEEAETEILLQVLAGSDTSATTIRSAVLCISTNPRVLRQLQAEIDSVAPYPSNKVVSDATTRNLPYLAAIVKETLRWLPPAMDMAPKKVPPEGDEWNGLALPPGTEIGWSSMGVMRDTELWGDDADHFRPDRWLEAEADPPRLRDMDTAVELVFGGAGRYQCLGRIVALIEIKKVLFEIFRRYELETVYPDKPWRSREWNIIEQTNFWLKAYHRDNSPTMA